jgi:hypothetical protein
MQTSFTIEGREVDPGALFERRLQDLASKLPFLQASGFADDTTVRGSSR